MSMRSGTITANGDTEVELNGSERGGFSTIYLKGTWGSGTMTLKASPNETSTDAQAVPGFSFTGDGMQTVQLNSARAWLSLSGATSPSIKWAVV